MLARVSWMRGAWATALAAALVAHLVTLYIPGPQGPGTQLLPHLDKLIHVVAFGVPAFLLRILVRRWWPIAVLVLHAPLSEVIQHHWIPFRGGEVGDVVADLVGVALGVLAAAWLRPRRHAGQPHDTPA